MNDKCSSQSNTGSSHHHDRGYKYLFSHKELVQELLEHFLPVEFHQMMDFDTLRKDSESFITEAFKDRADDVIWSVQINLESGQSTRLFLYLLIEFQSKIDPTMPVRMLQYVGLLYEHLLREHKIDIDLTHGLPPVLPIVLYNGRPTWTAATSMVQIQPNLPAFLKPYQPAMDYFLLDEQRIEPEKLNAIHNALSLVFQFEQAYGIEAGRAVILKFVQEYKTLPHVERIGKVLYRWVVRDLQKRLPKGMISDKDIERLQDLEDPTMLAENVENWFVEARLEGLQRGELKGKLEAANTMIKEFGLSVKDVALKLKVPLDDLVAYLNKNEPKS
ncbi:MAG: Rpn family recombination-promoting nuclease/putative transposase [Thiomicrospira sp.]